MSPIKFQFTILGYVGLYSLAIVIGLCIANPEMMADRTSVRAHISLFWFLMAGFLAQYVFNKIDKCLGVNK